MAPEIMRYNGEEEYTEKVDCFSYGMLLYEIFTLRQPFEGHEAVKEAVLEGARPPLSPRDLQYPCSMLDIMRRCWSGAPELRPSAAALVALCAAPECAALRDAAAARPARPAAAMPLTLPPEDGLEACEVWYGGAEPERIHALLVARNCFTHHHSLRVPPDNSSAVLVTALCRAGPQMWAGDSVGRVLVYSGGTCELLWSARVTETVGGAPGAVAALLSLAPLPRMAIALACGRLFLVSSERPAPEASFVLTELGAATELCCLATVPTQHGCELWAGGDRLHTYTLSTEGVSAAAAQPAPAPGALAFLAPAGPAVLAACRPGTCVYAWCMRTKRVLSRLDCSKLAPCSESLQSIALDETTQERERCRVTALCVVGSQVLVGTARGCVVVAQANTLAPITVFRPYEEEVRAIVSLPSPGPEGPLVATFGAGYRPLLQRYAPAQSNNSTATHSGYYCLLWRAQHWLPD